MYVCMITYEVFFVHRASLRYGIFFLFPPSIHLQCLIIIMIMMLTMMMMMMMMMVIMIIIMKWFITFTFFPLANGTSFNGFPAIFRFKFLHQLESIHTYSYILIHTYIYMYIYLQIYTYVHTYMQTTHTHTSLFRH